MISTNRKFISKKRQLLISFDESTKQKNYKLKKVSWNEGNTLGYLFQEYLSDNNIELDDNYSLYLKRQDIIIKRLSKEKQLYELDLKKNDEIIVSFKSYDILPLTEKCNNSFNNNIKYLVTSESIETSNKKENKTKKRNSPFLFIIIILIPLILIAIIFLIKWLKNKKDNKEEKKIEYIKEKLISNKKYPVDLLLRYNISKIYNIELEAEKTVFQTVNQEMDFIFIVRKNEKEKNEKDLIEKEKFEGYIALLKAKIINETEEKISVYDRYLNYILDGQILDKNKQMEINESLNRTIGENGNYCFAKVNFYLNGKIIDFYLPENFEKNCGFTYIDDIARLMIPKISPELYVSNITEELNKIRKMNEFKNKSFDNENHNKSNKIKLSKKRHKSYTIPYERNEIYNRDLEVSNNSKFYINYTGDIKVDEYIVEPESESIDIDLREANENKIRNATNYTNLTQYSIKTVENDEVQMKGSLSNSTIYSIIDKDGILESIEEIKIVSMKSDNMENEKYNKDNQTNLDDSKFLYNKDFDENKNIFNNISNLYIINSVIINRSDYFKNEKINNEIYDYFDNFPFYLYNKTNNNFENEYENENITRDLEQEVTYYGLKKTTRSQTLYKYNILGINMEKQLFTEIDPSKGTTNSYFVIIFGNKNVKEKLNDLQTNLHVITERKNKMAYNLLLLLNKTNNDLKERNKHYLEVILDLEKNVSDIFEDYDYSDLFKNDIDNLYLQVRNFSGEVFNEFILLINRVYDNFTTKLNNSINEGYEFINEIVNITRNSYINYTYNMIDIMEEFQNKALTFFDNIEDELKHVKNFHIDILYDLVDLIYDIKLIFTQFNKNLFRSIEKGIKTFEYDIKDFIDEVLGDLLYVTDFLTVNLKRNEIIKKAINSTNIEEASNKLNQIKNTIMTIMGLITINIKKDYAKEMSLNNINGIKNYSYLKENEFIENTQNKSNILIDKIKSIITNIELYDLYAENIDIINEIINKTVVEYISDIYNNIIIHSLKLRPEFMDEKSNLTIKENQLFSISQNIWDEINNEINDINEYIVNYYNNWLNQKIYMIYYNLYNFRKYFLNSEMNELLNEYIKLFKEITNDMVIESKKVIDKNYELAYQVFKDEIFTTRNISFSNDQISFSSEVLIYISSFCTGFVNRYYEYKKKFEELSNIFLDKDYLNSLKNYFNLLKKKIIEDVKNNIVSIDKYKFRNGSHCKIS